MKELFETYNITDWLPTSKKEAKIHGWEEADVVLFSGDAYIDHPSFGAAVIGRVLEAMNLKVAIVPQPNWQDDLRDFKKFGKPRLFFGVTAGSMDSMINHYTANLRKRSNDAYSPNGKSGFRPDYATTKYCNILKDLYPDTPIVIGGVEASLRRYTHFDYWSDMLKPGILFDSKADLLVYGMGEKAIEEIVKLLEKGVPFNSLDTISQTAILRNTNETIPENKNWETVNLHSHETCKKDKYKFAANFKVIEEESNKTKAKRIIQKINNQNIIVNPPYPTLSEKEIDKYFDLPYTRLPHPRYKNKENIPAYEMIKHSINIHRGCFGGCAFCTISAHQGKFVSSRSEKSIMKEVEKLTQMPDFKGNISDLGGPSANMYKMKGKDLNICDKCKRPSCIFPSICSNLETNPKQLTDIYKKVSNKQDVKKVFIGSGIRYDLFMNNLDDKNYYEYISELVKNHVSGRLKVAPEHTSDKVLKIMRKPSFKMFNDFKKLFDNLNSKFNLKQQLIPYFISSHPNSTDEDMAELAIETKKLNFKLEQIQDLTPTPMTLSTVMYYTGINPYTQKKVYVAKSKKQKLAQRKFFFWYKPENKKDIIASLKQISRNDLIDKLFGKSAKANNAKF
ncbi:MAG: YgiQ family radical SAM protein, partial [Bacteroidota bacterium]|nr:YgiQ family radical SAM protein [Bacteroidota bacterium]